MDESDLEQILGETLNRVNLAIRYNDPQTANYWMLEHIKDINKFSGFMPDGYLLKCARRYNDYNERVTYLALGIDLKTGDST